MFSLGSEYDRTRIISPPATLSSIASRAAGKLEKKMVDDPSKSDERDRAKVAGEQDHEVDYLVKKHGKRRPRLRY